MSRAPLSSPFVALASLLLLAACSGEAGTTPTIVLVLTPLTGNVPIHVTLGSFAVTLSPPAPTLAVGQTVPLNVSITDWNGNPVTVWNGNPVTNATVSWATDHPGIASVDGSGLVTAQGAGSTKIAATFQGAVGTAAVTVMP